MQRGFRNLLNKQFDITKEIFVAIEVNGQSTYDSCCFAVDGHNKAIYFSISLKNIETIEPIELYSKMLAEFPIWLKEANIF